MADHPTLQPGSKGPSVAKAQKALKARGYDPGALDGIFGQRTTRAVTAYQNDRKDDAVDPLVATGKIDAKTWARLDPPTIKKGSKGEPVRLLQFLLGEHGFAVTIDGDFGPNTEKALKDFQEFTGTLVVDGIAGPLTWIALGS